MKAGHLLNSILLIPFVMVLATVFIVGSDLGNGVVSGKYFWFYLSIALSAVAVILSFCINRKSMRFFLLDLLILLFGISGLIVSCYHNDAFTNKAVILLLILVLYFYFKIFLIQYKWNAFVLILFFLLTGMIEAVWGLKQLYGISFSQHNLFKTTGSFYNPGPYAGYLAMVVPLAFYYIIADYRIFNTKFRFVYLPFYLRWGISVLTLISILLILPATMSRASWIAAFSGCLFTALFFIVKKKRLSVSIDRFGKRTKLYGSLILGLLIIALTGIYYLKKDSADGRMLIWKISTQVIHKYPFGVGLGNYSGIYGEEQAGYFMAQSRPDNEQLIAGNPEYAFNEYIQICSEFGVLPFFLFVSIIVYTLCIGIRKKRYAATGAFLSLLVFASMSYPFSILPFLVSFVFLAAMCSMDTVRTGKFCSARSFWGMMPLLILLFFITGIFVRDRYPLYDAYRKWNKVKILYNANIHKDAVKEYAGLYPYLNHEIQFLFEYAQSLSKSGQYEESNQILQAAMKISCDPMLYNIMGKNCQALKKYAQAEQCFRKASMIVPNRIYPYYLLAKLYEEDGKFEQVCEMAGFIRTKEVKVHSKAVDEIREELKLMCEKYKKQ